MVSGFSSKAGCFKMKVYLVGDCGPEHNNVEYACLSAEKAEELFQKHRLELLQDVEEHLEWAKKESRCSIEMYMEIIKNLKETDSKKIDCYPHDTPYIIEMEVTE